MFFVGALATLPALINATPNLESVGSGSDLMTLLGSSVFVDRGTDITMWHVIAFTWGANLAFHGGLGDMTILRFARNKAYGWYSSLGMFIGHFAAWIAAGIMGAGAAYIMKTPLTELDAGGVAFQALGAVGILAVVIAGWTTSNPTIYRAGLAFQSLNPKWSRERVTLIVGIITAIIACSPSITWASTALFAYVLGSAFGIHIFFLFIPTWIAALILYPLLSSFMGAKSVNTQTLDEMERIEAERKAAEAEALRSLKSTSGHKRPAIETALLVIATLSLLVCLYLGFKASGNENTVGFKSAIIWPTVIYFITATALVLLHKDKTEDATLLKQQRQAQPYLRLPTRQMLSLSSLMIWAMANWASQVTLSLKRLILIGSPMTAFCSPKPIQEAPFVHPHASH